MKTASVGFLLLSVWVGVSEGSSNLAGHWQGTISAGGIELGLIVHVIETPQGWKGTLDVPLQGTLGLVIDDVRVEDGEMRLKLNRLRASYRGVLNAKRTETIGIWEQSGAKSELVMTKVDKPATFVVPNELKGAWEGKLADFGLNMRIGLRLETVADGMTLAGFASPNEGKRFLPINLLTYDGTQIKANSHAIGATYTGVVNAGRTEIVGTWNQRGLSIPLTLKRVAKISERSRPQTPKPPFPYLSQDVVYPNTSAKLMLGGTLTTPKAAGPFPAVILITGSGPQDRDETLFGHKPFLVIADALTRRGIAVLRVDDRGVGKSTGSQVDATSQDFAGDVSAGVAFLKTRKEIDVKKIGLLGHSEGGLIGPMVAARGDDVAFLVLLAAPGLRGSEILKAQNRQAVATQGLSELYLKHQDQTLDTIYTTVVNEKDPKAALAKLTTSINPAAGFTNAERLAFRAYSGHSLEMVVGQLSQPWYRFFISFDPKASLEKVRCPVLVLNGEHDLQVIAPPNLKAISEALTQAGNSKVKVISRPGLNHLFQACITGDPSEYVEIEQTFDLETLTIIADWIAAIVARR